MKTSNIIRKIFLSALQVILMSIFIVSCESVSGNTSLELYGVPLTVSINTNGKISFKVQSGIRIPTPIGIVTAGVVVNPSKHYDVPNTLTVRLNREDHIFDLHGQDFRLDFESGYYEAISVRKDGKDLYLEVMSEGNGDLSTITIPINERIKYSRCGILTIEEAQIVDNEFKVFYNIRLDPEEERLTFCPLNPSDSCLEEYDSKAVAKIFTPSQFSPKRVENIRVSTENIQGYIVFSKDILKQSKAYKFVFACDWYWMPENFLPLR